jgi:hypothetical protein
LFIGHPARERLIGGAMAIPEELEGLCRLAAARAAAAKSTEVAAEARRAEQERVAETRLKHAREKGAEAADAIWQWLNSADAAQLRLLVREYRLEDVRLFGPVWGETGEPADGLRSGCQVLHLVDDEPAVRFLWRLAPSAGADEIIRDAERLRELLQPLPLLRFAEDIRSGAVWTDLAEELRGLHR